VQGRREMGYPVPTKVSLKLNPDMAMLFATFGANSNLPCPAFSAHAESISKDVEQTDITR